MSAKLPVSQLLRTSLLLFAAVLLLVGQPPRSLAAQSDLTIMFGETLFGSIGCRATDVYGFDGDEDDMVVIHVVETADYGGVCGSACFCFDQRVELRSMDGRLLAGNSSPGSGNSRNKHRTQIGPIRLPATGRYSLSVRDIHNNGRGEYRVFIQRLNDPLATEILPSGVERLSTLSAGQVATFQFDAWPLDLTTIEMVADGSSVLPRIALYDPLGELLALPDSGSIEIELAGGGLFTLFAFSEVDESGNYRITVDVEAPPPNQAPLAVPDVATTPLETAVVVDVLANDSDPDGDDLFIVSVAGAAQGVVINNGRYLTYTPNTGFVGSDGFTYLMTDGILVATAEVAVTVTDVGFIGVPLVVSAGTVIIAGDTLRIYGSVQDIPSIQFRVEAVEEAISINSVVVRLTNATGDVGQVSGLRARLVEDTDADGMADSGETHLASAAAEEYVTMLTLDLGLPIQLMPGSGVWLLVLLDVDVAGSTGTGQVVSSGLVSPLPFWGWGLAVSLLLLMVRLASPVARRSTALAVGIGLCLIVAGCTGDNSSTAPESEILFSFGVTLPQGAIGGSASEAGWFAAPSLSLVGSTIAIASGP